MKILVTGATGFVGRALVARLLQEGRQVSAWVRSVDRARTLLGPGLELLPAEGGQNALRAAVRGADAVINLAGEPIFARRWSEERRTELVESRVFLTAGLVDAMEDEPRRPSVMVSASAVGYYGDRGEERLGEKSGPGSDFLARLCFDWENAARRAEKLGVRVVTPRFGLVLGPGGGILSRLLPLFRKGLGGRLGSGEQFLSWIQLEDLLRLLCLVTVDDRFDGAINAVGPRPITNSELTRAVARAVDRPAFLPLPAMALKLAVGEAAEVLLASQRVMPDELERLGFEHRFEDIDAALSASV
ncbi:MAG: TIGR01777 family oxidoreductase [Polyangia bacterium]